MPSMEEIARELNERSEHHPIGRIQEIRRDLKGLARAPTRHLFTRQSTRDEYAFHLGGRTELQFNVGFEKIDGKDYVRYGVAFSLEPSRTLPDITVLAPRIARFNEFLRQYPNEFADLRMWHWIGDERSTNYPPSPIPSDNVRPHIFIFIGSMQQADDLNYEAILDIFDRLLPLYRYIQGSEAFPAITVEAAFNFRPGCSVKPIATTAARVQTELNVSLRHNEIQFALYRHLSERYGPDAVGTEHPNGAGARIDVVLRLNSGYHFYEIKTSSSVRGCMREALAQLLEYAFWPGAQEAERLIVVGEPSHDGESRTFLALLRERFALPIYYEQFDIGSGTLVA